MAGNLFVNKGNIIEECDIYYKWERHRIDNNKNVITVTTGQTGSGKSMMDLRRAELCYQRRFNKVFPVRTNVCFSIAQLMKLITSGELKKGDIVILEEAGFNAGSQDWQNRATKMFNYLLQTFRSMNVCLYMNLPVLSMLAKQARQLVHLHFETNGINFETQKVRVKPLAHQLNQQTGKSYWKFLRVHFKNKVKKIQRMEFSLPSLELRNIYEAQKAKFLSEMTKEFTDELEEKERAKLDKMARDDLTERQRELYNQLMDGRKPVELAKERNISTAAVYEMINAIKNKGYKINPKKK
jgi:hypothetical protein